MITIAILDDDQEFQEIAQVWLSSTEFSCTCFTNGRDLVRSLQSQTFDMFVLDWNLPDLSGIHVLEWLRNRLGGKVPILMLTSRMDEEDIVAALTAGADDFVSKPVSENILMARLRALARRLHRDTPHAAGETYGRYSFDIALRQLLFDGQAIDVTLKELQLALMLFRNLNAAVSRAHVMEAIWGMASSPDSRTLDIHISKIRRKLMLRPENGFIIQPIYGFGYRLEEVGDA
jgi:DNA-binding response OmpR family regulator